MWFQWIMNGFHYHCYLFIISNYILIMYRKVNPYGWLLVTGTFHGVKRTIGDLLHLLPD